MGSGAVPSSSMSEELAPGDLDPNLATVVLFVPSSPEHWRFSVSQVLRCTSFRIVVGVLYPADGKVFENLDDRVDWFTVGSVSELVNRTYEARSGHMIVVNDAVELPDGVFDTALGFMRNDPRVATVSFLSNASDSLSFPVRNLPQHRLPDGWDTQSITDRLRSAAPEAAPAPIPVPVGSVVVISQSSLGSVGELVAPSSARFDVAVADFGARAAEKGFVNLVDTSTVVGRFADVSVAPVDDHMREDDLGWLLHRHRWLIGYLEEQRMSGDSTFAHAHQVARVKLTGLTILIDGSCFGPNETGTQVATVQTILALAEHRDVKQIFVSVTGEVPAYARRLLDHRKVDLRSGGSSAFGPVDIAFRPYQPSPHFDLDLWSSHAVRVVVSMLDVIAYVNGSYFETGEVWANYRRSIDDCLRSIDAVTVISTDVREQMILHSLPIEMGRVNVVPLGATNVPTDQSRQCPLVLEQRGFGAKRFALMLGVNYHHKNRELAIASHRILREHGHDLDLVMAGPAVPYGSTRLAEAEQRAALRGADEWLHIIPQVTEAEKNWLLSHASLAWYPTSAEGFGFVPFETAFHGVPSVSVAFGPLRELAGGVGSIRPSEVEVPLMAKSWAPAALSAVAEQFLADPALTARHCAALQQSARRYSWEAHADRLVLLFREVLAKPSNRKRFG